MKYLIVGLAVTLGLVGMSVLRRNGFAIRFFNEPVPQVILTVGDRVTYPDRNSHQKVARVVGFRSDGRAMLHVGHPHHSHFSRPVSQLWQA